MAALAPRARIAHLLRRAGFGASEAELNDYQALGFEASVDRLLNPEQVADDLDAKVAALNLDLTVGGSLPIYWLFRMINTKRPLQEKMSYFWHGHFATALSKVNSPQLMLAQYQLFNRLGLGNFSDLTLAVSQDPAMLVWLDGNQNRKNAPNENYGRELLELFMLGIGNYTENDVKAAARAFTGWFFDAERDTRNNNRITSAKFAFNEKQHDTGTKTFLGQTGNWNGDDIIKIALAQPACARFIAGKLFAFFVWDNPDAATVAPFADLFAKNKYDLRETMRAILLSAEFSSERAYRAKTKSPTEHVAGVMRTLGVATPARDFATYMRRMGQELFNPPNVGGWTSGLGWIGPGTLLERTNFVNRIVTARQATNNSPIVFDPSKLLAGKNIATAEQLVDYIAGLLLDGAIADAQRAALLSYLRLNDQGKPAASFTLDAKTLDSKVRGLIHLVSAMPEYQLN